ncbi:uncharacterized protein BO97DRAFT_372395 [Aspergillus homomorphus CBS 101889]|uniref:Elongator complex protein 6 n=1 Tax=Aspergillus homomorphus (strain CBS 101889) TaxID=1450537 RepID=A0A395HS09_ASPHC|nr:hypothetical protein BO97DRAFT_372395 [Aspergillus homomorphus CBS 101889]RAL10607.1 hypothetical protein BO97DRAFT_372395 [Aspergillus homomorphus CBS 101889]
MPSQPPLPPLLTPYVSSLPPSSLTLLSSVLGATGNWLVLRFLHAALSAPSTPDSAFSFGEGKNGKKQKVVLVSFLRGWEFWRSEAKRLGLDLARLTDKRQFAFVDGLSELFSAPTTPTTTTTTITQTPPPSQPSLRGGPIPQRTVLPARSAPGPIPARGPQLAPRPAATAPAPSVPSAPREIGPVKRLHWSGNGATALEKLEKDIADVVEQLWATAATTEGGEESEVLLILDAPDLLLAATGPNKGVGATEMSDWVMGLQQYVHATVMTLAADSPLIHNTSAFGHQMATPLETEHAAFAIGSAHRAHMVMQLRNLETGAARDVSGVLRVSKGGAWGQRDNADEDGVWEEREVLYFIQRDGGVSVFGRGE